MTGTNKIHVVGFPESKQLRFDIHMYFNQFMINSNLFDEYSSNVEMSQLVQILSYESLEKLKHNFSSM